MIPWWGWEETGETTKHGDEHSHCGRNAITQKQFLPMKGPSLRRVAAAADVSPSTASRALNDNPQVPAKVRERVRRIADQLGYRKSAIVSSVMRDFRSAGGQVLRGTLAFLACDPPREWVPHGAAAFVQAFLDGVRTRAQAQGYAVETFLVDHPEALPPRRLAQVLVSRGISGVMLCTAARLRSEIAFPWEKFASVTIGSFYFRPRLHRAGRDYYRDVHASVEKLCSMGYRRIGFATHEKEMMRQDYMGLAAFTQASAHLPGARPIPAYRSKEPRAPEFLRWVRRHRLDAVMAEFGEALDWLRDGGYAVPRDLGYLSLNLSMPHDPAVSGLLIPYGEVGSAAVDLLTKLVEQREIGVPVRARAVQVRSDWHKGGTLLDRVDPS